MSYDLYFKPRTGAVDQHKIAAYFSSRPHYEVTPPQALYQNEDTGVYFVFEMQGEAEGEGSENYPVLFNINFFRPSYFIEEAEPEVTAFVSNFDMIVSDPQLQGMGEGEYDPGRLKSGWDHGNEFGYSALLKNQMSAISLPTAVLRRAWSWNFKRQQLQEDLGEGKFVPRVMFIQLEGAVKTAAVWPDGIPIAVPDVDYLIVPRKELAPRRLFRRVKDTTVVALKDAMLILRKHGTANADGTLILNYDAPTDEVAKYVASLPADEREIKGVAADQVLDRELVEKHST